jgi:hypothetical protein
LPVSGHSRSVDCTAILPTVRPVYQLVDQSVEKLIVLRRATPFNFCSFSSGYIIFLHFVKVFFHSILFIVFREVLVIGLANVPQYGPVIFTGNHANQVINAVTMVCTCQRTISYLVAKRSWNRPIIGHFVWALGAVLVKCSQDLAEVGVGKHRILHKLSDVEQLEGDDNDAANQSHKPSDVEQLEVDYNDTANQSNNHNNPAGISKHETMEIKMKDAKKVTPKHEAIRSSNENSDIKSKDAARDVLEEKMKPATTACSSSGLHVVSLRRGHTRQAGASLPRIPPYLTCTSEP